MPIRSEWKLAREGITPDTISRLLSRTLFNPALTLPLLLAARYTSPGRELADLHPTAIKWLTRAAGLGVAGLLSGWLDSGVTNNFCADEYAWKKEVVVVTGGADGIGGLVVRLLAEQGIKVAVIDVQDLTYEAPPTVHFFKCDLSSPSSITSTATKIRESLGHPTVLINNAGVARGKTILATTPFDLNLTFKVNTLSHYHLAQEFLPHMVATNHGMIVTVASLAGWVSAPAMVDYAASKSAAVAFHEGLAAELVTHYAAPRVRTVLVCQGYTRTKLFEGFGDKALYPETVAEAIVKAVLGGRSAQVTVPELAWWVAPKLRGWPLWTQYAMRKKMDRYMRDWRGRQVVQPSEKGQAIEESAVLVG